MCEALRQLMKDEIDKEVQERVDKEIGQKLSKNTQDTLLVSIKNLMKNTKWTAEQAMEALNIPIGERSKYISQL